MPSDSSRSLKLSIIVLPFCDCELPFEKRDQLEIGNRQSEMKNPALNSAGLQKPSEVFRVRRFELPELFSRLFCVAASRLNSPRFTKTLIRRGRRECQGLGVRRESVAATAL